MDLGRFFGGPCSILSFIWSNQPQHSRQQHHQLQGNSIHNLTQPDQDQNMDTTVTQSMITTPDTLTNTTMDMNTTWNTQANCSFASKTNQNIFQAAELIRENINLNEILIKAILEQSNH